MRDRTLFLRYALVLPWLSLSTISNITTKPNSNNNRKLNLSGNYYKPNKYSENGGSYATTFGLLQHHSFSRSIPTSTLHSSSISCFGFAPGPVLPADGSNGGDGIDLRSNYGLEPERKRLKEQGFLENNFQTSSIYFLQPRSVSTGLGLSLDNTRVPSAGDSALLSHAGNGIDCELQQQDVEMD